MGRQPVAAAIWPTYSQGYLLVLRISRRFLIMEDVLLSYPQKEDSLFSEIAMKAHNISLDPYVSLGPIGDNWAKYIIGYKEAADILADKIIDNRSFQDYLVFPTIYLYRHFVELSIKLIIRYGYELYNIKKEYNQIHTLDELWRDCRLIIEKNWPQEPEYIEILNATENIIKDLSKIDPSSYETRYPESKRKKDRKTKEDKDDRIFTMEGIPDINLKNMKKLMEKLIIFWVLWVMLFPLNYQKREILNLIITPIIEIV